MIKVTSNINEVLTKYIANIENLQKEVNQITKECAVNALPILRSRVHTDGIKQDGSQIGTYKSSYLRTREKNNRGSDTKVVLSLTRQMESDLSVQAVDNNTFGIGFNNATNSNKAQWMKEKYGDIYGLTAEEKIQITDFAKEQFLDAIHK